MTPHEIIIDASKLDLEGVHRGRVNMIKRKRLPVETGVPGLTVEFSLSIVPESYFTPRHRHNFDRIRYTLTVLQSTGYGDLGSAISPRPSITDHRSRKANAPPSCCSSRAPAAFTSSATRK